MTSPFKKYLYIGVAVLLIVVYWFGIRPNKIRRNCIDEARISAIQATQTPEYILNTVERSKIQDQLTDSNYKNCIRDHGLNK